MAENEVDLQKLRKENTSPLEKLGEGIANFFGEEKEGTALTNDLIRKKILSALNPKETSRPIAEISSAKNAENTPTQTSTNESEKAKTLNRSRQVFIADINALNNNPLFIKKNTSSFKSPTSSSNNLFPAPEVPSVSKTLPLPLRRSITIREISPIPKGPTGNSTLPVLPPTPPVKAVNPPPPTNTSPSDIPATKTNFLNNSPPPTDTPPPLPPETANPPILQKPLQRVLPSIPPIKSVNTPPLTNIPPPVIPVTQNNFPNNVPLPTDTPPPPTHTTTTLPPPATKNSLNTNTKTLYQLRSTSSTIRYSLPPSSTTFFTSNETLTSPEKTSKEENFKEKLEKTISIRKLPSISTSTTSSAENKTPRVTSSYTTNASNPPSYPQASFSLLGLANSPVQILQKYLYSQIVGSKDIGGEDRTLPKITFNAVDRSLTITIDATTMQKAENVDICQNTIFFNATNKKIKNGFLSATFNTGGQLITFLNDFGIIRLFDNQNVKALYTELGKPYNITFEEDFFVPQKLSENKNNKSFFNF